MKTLENFGEWVGGKGVWFIPVTCLILFFMYSRNDVVLDAKQWQCTVAETRGIEAICTQYTRRKN